MQINNIVNGYKIIVNKINLQEKRLVYTLYERMIFDDEGKIVKQFPKQSYSKILDVDLTTLADNSLSIEQNLNKKYLEALKASFTDTEDWEIATNQQNWLFDARPMRITILRDFVLKELEPIDAEGNLSEIGTIINNEKITNFGFYLAEENDTVMTMYINQVDESDTPIIAPYLGTKMWLETKLN